MASYPGAIKSFATRSPGQVIQSATVNDLQDEITAIETALITGPVTFPATTLATLSVTGGSTLATVTMTGNVLSDLKFTDATYDIGKSAATRPRDLFLSRNATVGGTINVTGVTTVTNSLFQGTSPNEVYISGGTINGDYNTNAVGNLYLNWVGYQGGTTQFRDTYIGNGKTAAVMSCAGTTKVVTFPGYTATTWVSGDKYLVVDASGVIHRSAIGPAS